MMDLQTRKLNVIGYLLEIQDENLFSKIESTIIESQKRDSQLNLKPFTQKQLIDRAFLANQDYSAGRFKTQEQLEKESEKW